MSQIQPQVSSIERQPITADPVVLCAADERYAMPLAVTLMTAGERLREGHELRVFLVDNGLSEQSLAMLKETLAGLPVSLQMAPRLDLGIDDLGVSHHISRTAYLRLFADRWLPDDLEQVLYLDSDLLIEASLTEIWQQPLEDRYCLAVPDIACPFIDSNKVPRQRRRFAPYVAAYEPIPNYRELGLEGSGYYFNSGVMLLNLRKWRDESLGTKLLDCLRRNKKHVWCWDQYALNAVLGNNWGRLPWRWNVGSHLFEYPDENRSPLSQSDFLEMRDHPAIIHFTTEFKPWDYSNRHPWRDRFFAAVDRTAWKGWRPSNPGFSLQKWWTQQAVYWVRQSTIGWRKLTALRAGE